MQRRTGLPPLPRLTSIALVAMIGAIAGVVMATLLLVLSSS